MYDRKALVLTTPESEERWSDAAEQRMVICVRNFRVLCAAVEGDHDIGQVIFDRSIDSFELLRFLSTLPKNFQGDVLSIRHDGTGFLSAIGRGDGRLLYSLQPIDVEFYLELRFPSPLHVVEPVLEAGAFQMSA